MILVTNGERINHDFEKLRKQDVMLLRMYLRNTES